MTVLQVITNRVVLRRTQIGIIYTRLISSFDCTLFIDCGDGGDESECGSYNCGDTITILIPGSSLGTFLRFDRLTAPYQY